MAQPYLRYLSLLELKSHPISCDKAAQQMLNFLGTKWSAGESLSVLHVIGQTPGISRTTAQKLLKSLRDGGYVSIEMDEKDHRGKRVLPTKLALEYFDKMGKLILQAGRAFS